MKPNGTEWNGELANELIKLRWNEMTQRANQE